VRLCYAHCWPAVKDYSEESPPSMSILNEMSVCPLPDELVTLNFVELLLCKPFKSFIVSC